MSISKADERRYEKLREYGCIACRPDGGYCGRVEIHHLVDKGYREYSGGNQATLPLGEWHHRGVPLPGLTVKQTRAKCGPSLFHESKKFHATYGRQRELLAKVNEDIGETA